MDKKAELDRLQKTVCEVFNVDYKTYKENASIRKREFVECRQVSMYLAKKRFNLDLTTIGTFVCKKDHATVIHAIKTISNLLQYDKDINRKLAAINKALDGLNPTGEYFTPTCELRLYNGVLQQKYESDENEKWQDVQDIWEPVKHKNS